MKLYQFNINLKAFQNEMKYLKHIEPGLSPRRRLIKAEKRCKKLQTKEL